MICISLKLFIKLFLLPLSLLKGDIFSKTYPSFLTVKEGSTSLLGLLPSGKKREPLLLVALNRYAIRLAGHQSPRQFLRDGTACETLQPTKEICLKIFSLTAVINFKMHYFLFISPLQPSHKSFTYFFTNIK